VPPHQFRRPETPAIDEDGFCNSEARHEFRVIQPRDVRIRSFSQRDHFLSERGEAFVQTAGVADDLVGHPQLAQQPSQRRYQIPQAAPCGDRVLAVKIPMRGLKQVRITVEREIDQPSAVFGGERDEVGEQDHPVGQASATQRDINISAISWFCFHEAVIVLPGQVKCSS
jgi:hypothetical protein